ncbi:MULTISPECIES: copper resistance protein NlpE N-terminal domain-containing protein [Halomonas]|uniref:NlpE-like protein n=1 Tax=Halomonas ventosae TaxID=229007 RepID=A0A4R6H787_9GAMM|nr:copper resistance protein NlpE N-terminal domain-containing protein [Halomonas ventosae]TDO03668.1 NlpE-like protein [Halomonas ventosae]
MQIRSLLAGTAMVALLVGCATGPADQTAAPGREATTATYEGTLPCRNCDGIDLSVTLNGEAQGAAEQRNFELEASYRAHPQNPPDENYTGNWEVLQGTEQDPTATVYELTPDGEGQTYYFLRIDPQTLELIDPNLRRFQNSEMLRLKRQ